MLQESGYETRSCTIPATPMNLFFWHSVAGLKCTVEHGGGLRSWDRALSSSTVLLLKRFIQPGQVDRRTALLKEDRCFARL